MDNSNTEKAKPENFVELGGKRYNFILDFGTLRRFQKITGQNPFSAKFLRDFGAVEIHGLVLAMIQKTTPEFTEAQVDELINIFDSAKMAQLTEAIKKAIEISQASDSKKKTALPK